jgi:hypothetical protein
MADTFRVVIDVEKIRSNLWTREQARLTKAEICYWLQSVGFRPDAPERPGEPEPAEGAAATWLADAETLRRLDQSEVISVRPV